MNAHLSRRLFLSGACALGATACVGATTGSAPGPNPQLGHIVVGDGNEPVIVLHEWLGDHRNYDPTIPYLSTTRTRWILADLRGYGLSRGINGNYGLDEVADDVLSLMDSLGHDRFHVVGHSMTGMVAQYLIVRAPSRIKSVTAISPVPATGFKTDAAGLGRLRQVITNDDAFRAATVSRTGSRYNRTWLDRKMAIARNATPEAMVGYLDMFCGNDFAARVAGAKVPVTLITGAQDIAFYGRAALEPQFQALYPQLQTAVIADAGHYSMLETPILLASLLERAVLGEPLIQPQKAAGAGAPAPSRQTSYL